MPVDIPLSGFIRYLFVLLLLVMGWAADPVSVLAHSAHTITVTTLVDGEPGSLRSALELANQSSHPTVIDLRSVEGTIALTKPLPTLHGSITLLGDGNDAISGQDAVRVLTIAGGNVTLSHLTIVHGLAQGENGKAGGGGAAGMGGGLFLDGGTVTLDQVTFAQNQAIGGNGSALLPAPTSAQIVTARDHVEVNRGAIAGLNGISFPRLTPALIPQMAKAGVRVESSASRFQANRGAIAGINGIGINGIGSIAFGGGGGFGGFGNAGNGGNGGNAGAAGGNGGNGGHGGNGGIGIFGGFGSLESLEVQSMGAIAFGGGGGFGGFGNAGNGGNGGNSPAAQPIDPTLCRNAGNGGDGGQGGKGGFGGGGGSGGLGGQGGQVGVAGQDGVAGKGGFGGGNGSLGFGGGGAGLGGAIFVRTGKLILKNVTFSQNRAIAGEGGSPGQGKGGALFVMPQGLNTQAGIRTPAQVTVTGAIVFHENQASDAAGTVTDNDNVYGTI